MQLKYFGSKAWLAPRMDRLLGTSPCFTLPSSVLESWSTTSPPGVRAWRCAVDAFEPVANLHRCYLRRDPSSCAPCCALWGATWTGASTSRTPAGRSERPCRAPGRRPGALQRGRLHHKPVLGQEQFQARAARSAPGQSSNGGSNPVATAGLTIAILLPQIGWSNPVAAAGLGGAILLPQQD